MASGQAPVHLLGELVAHGFFAFNAIGLFERAEVEPAFFFLALSDDAGAIADEAVDQRDVRAQRFALNEIGLRNVFRHEDVRSIPPQPHTPAAALAAFPAEGTATLVMPNSRAMVMAAVMPRALKEPVGFRAFVLHPKMMRAERGAETFGLDERRHPLAQRNDGAAMIRRQHGPVTPHAVMRGIVQYA